MEEDMGKLNITEDMATHITSNPRSGKLGTVNEDDDESYGRFKEYVRYKRKLRSCPFSGFKLANNSICYLYL